MQNRETLKLWNYVQRWTESEVFESILLLNVLVEDEWDESWKNIWIWEKKTHETVNDIISN